MLTYVSSQADFRAPDYLQKLEPSQSFIRTLPLPIPLTSVRLVYPLTPQAAGQSYHVDPDTKQAIDGKQDTIIANLVRRPGHRGRFIAGSLEATGEWIEIPKPPEADPKKPEPKDEEIDTLRFEVEERTWVPTLLRAPLPGGVIDELRGKYSSFRTRHDEGYVRAAEAREKRREAWRAWQKTHGGMLMTPAKEARRKELAELKEKTKGEPVLSPEQLGQIGQMMAANGVVLTPERERDVRARGALRTLEEENKGGNGRRISEDDMQKLQMGLDSLQLAKGKRGHAKEHEAVWDVAEGRAEEAVKRPGSGGRQVWRVEDDVDVQPRPATTASL